MLFGLSKLLSLFSYMSWKNTGRSALFADAESAEDATEQIICCSLAE